MCQSMIDMTIESIAKDSIYTQTKTLTINHKLMKKGLFLISCLLIMTIVSASPRERLLMNYNWKFAFGKPGDVGNTYFTYLAKAGYGDGAAAAGFDDRTWRTVDLPHDWAVEADFNPKGSHSHGYKAVGPGFPESSIGWYRKSFFIPTDDLGKRIFIEFDGVMRDARIWVNGFYCGTELSGYHSFSYDITEYLNYGAENVIAVRADVSIEEGWFYEGAGIYRHVWLTKTSPLFVPQFGTFVTSKVNGNKAVVDATVKVQNKALEGTSFYLENKIINHEGDVVAVSKSSQNSLRSKTVGEYKAEFSVDNPHLWDLDNPYLYHLITNVIVENKVVDEYITTFGIRTIEWTADKGFFLNGRHVKLKGTNNHQNHAGVGVAIPDGLHEWRLKQLKNMGNNAYRMAHYPPSPALLEACDRIGMLVINENRLMGVTDDMLNYLKRLIVRDRNHPSVILWSIGNEEWAIEGNEKGARIAQTMQAFAKTIDNTRPINAAMSGNWTNGISNVIEVMGYNYLRHGDTDWHHTRFPHQPSVGTEEGSTNTVRGIYVDDETNHYLAAYDRPTPSGFMSIQNGWKHYAERDYLAGVFFWTGFDYRGEPTPFAWPSVTSYFGMFDLCGLPKDNVFYLKSWWSSEPVLHILPHWNWPGREGEAIDVWVYSNYDEVELFLNNKSLGKQKMLPNGHLAWKVNYVPGSIKAVGYKSGKKAATKVVSTTGAPSAVALISDVSAIRANREDVSVVTVQITDKKGLVVPDANLDVEFGISGPARIIGVGNGNPTSLEPERFTDEVSAILFSDWKETLAASVDVKQAVLPSFDCSKWDMALNHNGLPPATESKPTIFRGIFSLSAKHLNGCVKWMFRSIGHNQSLYINGNLIAENLPNNQRDFEFLLSRNVLREGKNVVAIIANPYVKVNSWDEMNTTPGALQVTIPAQPWQRKSFNGLAQVIIQSTGEAGDIVLTAKSGTLKDGRILIKALPAQHRPSVP